MTQRLYIDYDRHLYDPEPNLHKDKNAKMTEIQAYVNVLIENNRTYGDQLNALRRQNTQLRGQVELMMGDMLRERQKSEQLLANTRADYSREVGSLIEDLKDILSKKEQMQGSYKALLEQLSYQNEFDKRARAIQLDELQRNYQNKIKILNDRLQDQNKEIETNFYLQSDNKLRMVKEIDQLNYENCELKKINKDLRDAHLFDQAELARLSVNVKQLTKEREELGVNLLKVEQEKNNQLIEMKQSMAQLREQLNDQIDNLKKMETMLIAKDRQLQQLSERRDLQLRVKSELEGNKIQQSHQLNQQAGEIAELHNELARLKDFSSRELKRMSDLIRMLENDNTKACKQKNEIEHQLNLKQGELASLLGKLKKLEAEHSTATNTLIKVQQDNLELKQLEGVLRQDVDSLVLELRNQKEKCMLQANRIATLEQLLQKEKKKTMQLQHNNYDKETIVRQLPNEINKKYELQIQEILHRSDFEKGEILEQCQLQKEKLVRMYEKALREKETIFKEKIFLMESQIRDLASI